MVGSAPFETFCTNYLIVPSKDNFLKEQIKNSDSYEMFRKKNLPFIRLVGNSMYGIYDPFGVKLINRL